MLKVFRFTIFMIILSLFLFSIPLNGAAAGLDIWTESSYVNVFMDDTKPVNAATGISLVTARNETEAAQIILRNSTGFTINSVTFSDLTTSGTDIIAASNFKYNFVEYRYLATTDNITNPVRLAPGYFPDALSNEASIMVNANKTQPVWVKVYIPKDIAAATYTGTATVNTSLGNYNVDIKVEVNNVTIPDPANSMYDNSFWSQLVGAWTTNEDFIFNEYGYTRYSSQWWALMDKFAMLFKEQRTNNLFVNTIILLHDGGTTIDNNGNYTFNWSKFDEFIQLFIDRGVVKRLEGYAILEKGVGFGAYNMSIINKDANGNMIRQDVPYSSTEAQNFCSQYWPALKDHLQSKGWYGMWWQHVGDEPFDQVHVDTWVDLCDKIKMYCPEMKVGDALGSEIILQAMSTKGDILVPLNTFADSHVDYYKQRLQEGKTVWTYTCTGPQYNYLNRVVAQQVWKGRLLGWYNYRNDYTGYLHWGFNHWKWTDNDIPAGDSYTVYPDSQNSNVKNSIRYENLRDGIEDYELFKILEARDAGWAKSIAASIVTNSGSYSYDTGYMQWKRDELVRGAGGAERILGLVNPDFEAKDLRGWSGYGERSVVSNEQYEGSCCVKISSNDSAIEQVITGLKPNTIYSLSVWAKASTASDIAQLGVYGHGRNEVAVTTSSTEYEQLSLNFTTGLDSTSATIYLYKKAAGTGCILGDDFDLCEVSPNNNPEEEPFNPIRDPGFEFRNLREWAGYGERSVENGEQYSGSYCIKITKTDSAIEQKVTGLKPDTAYTLSAWVKASAPDDVAQLGVYSYGGTEVMAVTSSQSYTQLSINFKTGAGNTSAVIYLYKRLSGSGYILGDDFLLVEKTSGGDPGEDPEEGSDIQVSAPVFTDKKGNTVTELKGGECINITIKATNRSKTAANTASLVAALYDSKGVLEGYAVQTKNVEAEGSEDIIVSFDLPQNTRGYYIKVFVWDSFESMLPLANMVFFPEM